MGGIALSAHNSSMYPTVSVQHQQQINTLRLEAELDRTRMEAAHNYRMAQAGAQIAEMLAMHQVQQPQEHSTKPHRCTWCHAAGRWVPQQEHCKSY